MPCIRTLVVGLTVWASGSCFADSITVGTSDSANGFPFGSNSSVGTRYQQAYAAGDFAGLGVINISDISFFLNNLFIGNLRSGTYTLSLSTITAGINTLSDTNFDSNLGANTTLFTTVSLSGPAPATLSFSGTPFRYDPSQGNLLLDIVVANGSEQSPVANFQAAGGTANGIFSRYHNFGSGTIGYGLVTRFDYSSVPEPATLWLLIVPLLCLKLNRARAKQGRI